MLPGSIRLAALILANAALLGSSPLQAETCQPQASLTGLYKANDGGSYRIRASGNTVWWLGKSGDDGASWTNLFKGTRNGNLITGQWIDLNDGAKGAGTLSLKVTGNFQLQRIGATGSGFGGTIWLRPGCTYSNAVPID